MNAGGVSELTCSSSESRFISSADGCAPIRLVREPPWAVGGRMVITG